MTKIDELASISLATVCERQKERQTDRQTEQGQRERQKENVGNIFNR